LYTRRAWFCAVRLEPWDRGVIKPHEHTLSAPKSDRMRLLRATRAQVSPVYGIVRADMALDEAGEPLHDFEADGQRHVLAAVTGERAVARFRERLRDESIYVADGHHRYETALAFRDEVRAAAPAWTGEEPENFVLMALTSAGDPGLLVLPTHRLVNIPPPESAPAELRERFDIRPLDRGRLLDELARERPRHAIGAYGLTPGEAHIFTPREAAAVDALMPAGRPDVWKRLDVNVLQYGILQPVFGIDEAAVAAGALAYTQDAHQALAAVDGGHARIAFLLNGTAIDEMMAVADAGARMPQKSTYFYPKLPTGLVLRPLD
jgi:uncharacterized protein (DUF1015 family)